MKKPLTDISNPLEYALQVINNKELVQTDEFQDWIKEPENKALYDELSLYREVVTLYTSKHTISVDKEWQKFENKNNIPNKKHRRWLVPFLSASVAAIIILFLWFMPSQSILNEEIQAIVPEYIANNTPQEITLQKDEQKPVIIRETNQHNTGTRKGTEASTNALPTSMTMDVSDIKSHMYTLSIPRGKYFHLILEDKTEVWLNTDTKLRYPSKFASDKREIELEGEAYFKVAKDKDRPFIVRSKYMTTKVLGTEFNFRSYNKTDASVTLVEGSVIVMAKDVPQTILKPGQNASLSANNDMVIAEVDMKKFTSWIEGYFYFDNVSLEEIMKDLGRWYNVDIDFEDDISKKYKFKFWAKRDNTFQQTIDLLSELGKVSIQFENSKAKIFAIDE